MTGPSGTRVTCKHCGGAHPAFDCKRSTAARKADVQRPGTAERSKVTGLVVSSSRSCAMHVDTKAAAAGLPASKDGAGSSPGSSEVRHLAADTNSVRIGTASSPDRLQTPKSDVSASPPLDTVVHTQSRRKRGRPKTITDMRAYKAAKQREYRERKKSEHQ